MGRVVEIGRLVIVLLFSPPLETTTSDLISKPSIPSIPSISNFQESFFVMPGVKSSSSYSGQNADHNTDHSSFTGYRWSYFASLTDETLRLRVQSFIDSTNLDAVIEYANGLRNGKICKLLPDIGLGHNHLVRIIEFQDDVRWIARLRMPPLPRTQAISSINKQIMANEYNTIMLVKLQTKIPIPSVYAVELDTENIVKAQFMLMHCLRGNSGMDLSMEVPDFYKRCVFSKMAEVQVLRSVHQFPFRQNLISDFPGQLVKGTTTKDWDYSPSKRRRLVRSRSYTWYRRSF